MMADPTDFMKTAGDIFGAVQAGVGIAAPYANLALADASASAKKAAAFYQQGLYEVQAIDTLLSLIHI